MKDFVKIAIVVYILMMLKSKGNAQPPVDSPPQLEQPADVQERKIGKVPTIF